MSQKIEFTTATLKSFGRSAKGGNARFEFPLNQKGSAAMGWGEMQDWQHGADLDGDLAAMSVGITPKDPELRSKAISLDTQRVHNFKATRKELEGKRDKGTRWMIQCDVLFTDPTGCQKLEAYIQSCDKSTLRISYNPLPVQVPLEPELMQTEERRQAVLEVEN
jgi:hypothetical protein